MTPETEEEVIATLKEILDYERGRFAIELYTLYRMGKDFGLSRGHAYEKVLLALIARPITQENKLDG